MCCSAALTTLTAHPPTLATFAATTSHGQDVSPSPDVPPESHSTMTAEPQDQVGAASRDQSMFLNLSMQPTLPLVRYTPGTDVFLGQTLFMHGSAPAAAADSTSSGAGNRPSFGRGGTGTSSDLAHDSGGMVHSSSADTMAVPASAGGVHGRSLKDLVAGWAAGSLSPIALHVQPARMATWREDGVPEAGCLQALLLEVRAQVQPSHSSDQATGLTKLPCRDGKED